MATSTFQRTFAGGELAPALAARADLVKYVSGLSTCRNFMLLRSGGAANRPGTRLVAECKTSSTAVTLARYVSEVAGESLLLEVGDGYIRFYKNGAAVELSGVAAYNGGTAYVIGDIVESGGVNYYCVADTTPGDAPPSASWYAMPGDLLELPHQFGVQLFNWAQSGRVITLTSPNGNVPPYELINGGTDSTWIIRQVVTEPNSPIPQGLVGTPGAAGTLNYAYQVTAAAPGSYEESLSAGVAAVPLTAAPTTAAPIQLSWTAIPDVPEYYVYCDPFGNGTFGFVGTATGVNTFNDTGFIPDFAVTPPLVNEPFNSAGNYPRRSGNHQQRRLFSNTDNSPDATWGSRVGFIRNFAISSPLQDDDSISFKIAGNQHNPVRHLVGLKTLVVLTDGGAWAVGTPLQPLTPSSLFANQEGYAGVDPDVEPVIVGNAIIYLQARGSIIRDLRFDQEVEGLAGKDLTIFASHLFDGYQVRSMDYQQTPHSIVWACRSDGTLLGLTYLREQDVWGWHRHDSATRTTTAVTGSAFEHVCVVPEQGEDVTYFIVSRTIGGAVHRFVERLEQRVIQDHSADSFFVDCGLSYDGPPATTMSGLAHLNGQKVAVLADGVVVSNGWDANSLVVSAGAVTLPAAASVVHIGLYIQAQLGGLDLDVGSDTVIRDKKKSVKSLTLIVEKSTKLVWTGRDANNLLPYKLNPSESRSPIYDGPMEQAILTDYNDLGRWFLEMRDPVPFTLVGIIPITELGG